MRGQAIPGPRRPVHTYEKERCEADSRKLVRCKSQCSDLRVCLEETPARRTNMARIAAGISGSLSALNTYYVSYFTKRIYIGKKLLLKMYLGEYRVSQP